MCGSSMAPTLRAMKWFPTGAVASFALVFACSANAGSQQDRIRADSFDGFPAAGCDAGIPSGTTAGMEFARSLGLCEEASEAGVALGIVSAQLRLPSGSGTPHST